MNVNSAFSPTRIMSGFRPNPAETIEKGVELGADPVQQDLVAISAGIGGVEAAASYLEVASQKTRDSWAKGAYSIAAALSGSPATGAALLDTVEGLFADPISRGFFATAGALVGGDSLSQIADITAGYGRTPAENGLFGVAAAVAGVESANEAITVGLSEGQDTREGALFALATALAGGGQAVGPALSVARDYASSPALAGPYAVAAALAGEEQATAALKMAEDLGGTDQEKALFALVGGLVGAERGPGFVRMSRALSPQEGQVPAMALAAALTGADSTPEREAAAAASLLFTREGLA